MDIMTELVICVDCGIAAANNDYTGMDADTATRVRNGLAALGAHLVVGDDFWEFSKRACECCGTHLAGGRFSAVVLG